MKTIEMGRQIHWDTLPVGSIFRWPGGVSLFKKIGTDTAIVLNKPTRKVYPSGWEYVVKVFHEND